MLTRENPHGAAGANGVHRLRHRRRVVNVVWNVVSAGADAVGSAGAGRPLLQQSVRIRKLLPGAMRTGFDSIRAECVPTRAA